MSEENVVFLSNVRLSFPNIAEPQKSNFGGNEKISYGCDLIMDESHDGYKAFMAKYAEMSAEKWKDHAQQVMQIIHSDRKLRCYAAGSERINKKTFKPYDGYEGKVSIATKRDQMPQIIKPDGGAVDPADTMQAQALARKLYGGCYVNAAIKPWLQDNKHGRAIRCEIIALQFAGDGEAFGGGVTDASGMFGAAASATPNGADAAPGAGAAPSLPPFMQG